jgi:hypothetical protein
LCKKILSIVAKLGEDTISIPYNNYLTLTPSIWNRKFIMSFLRKNEDLRMLERYGRNSALHIKLKTGVLVGRKLIDIIDGGTTVRGKLTDVKLQGLSVKDYFLKLHNIKLEWETKKVNITTKNTNIY